MRHRIPAAQLVAALASAGAGAVHIAVTADHWSEWWVYGAQFLAAALIQFGLALAMLLRRNRALLGISAAAQSIFICAWAITRTVGRPFGPAAGAAEAVGYPDVLTVLLEIIAIAGALVTMTRGTRQPMAHAPYYASASAGGAVVLAAASIAVLTAISGGHHGSGGHHNTGGDHGGHHKVDQGSRTGEGSGTSHHETVSPSMTFEGPPESTPSPPSPPEGKDGHTHHHTR